MSEHKSKIALQEYYDDSAEGDRLSTGLGQLEFERTKILLKRFLPPLQAKVLDIGGATGHYSLWLANQGYEVHLIDHSPKFVQQAKIASKNQNNAPIASLSVGDACTVDFPDNFANALLLFGPLYHLTEQKDRQQALKEAFRVLKHGGVLFAAAISRFASAVDGVFIGYVSDPVFANIIKQDLIDGQHRNPTNNLNYFTDAYLHRPSDLKQEIKNAGFKNSVVFPVEGIVALTSNFEDKWKDQTLRSYLLQLIEWTEKEEEIIGISPHLLGVSFKE